MTTSTHQLSCMCGKVKGAVAVSAPTNHVVCYCRDCQAFARFLGQEAILDRHGGTEIVQTNASKVTLSEGMEHLAAIRLTNKGLLRYYAACCGTPLGNVPPTFKIDCIGLIHSCLDRTTLETHFGPINARLNTGSATGDGVPPASGLFPAIVKVVRMALRSRLSGQYRRSPFFTTNGHPIVQPQVLSASALRAAKGEV